MRSIPGEIKDNIDDIDEKESDNKSEINSVEVCLQSFNRLPVPLAHHSAHLFLKSEVNQVKAGMWPVLKFSASTAQC